MKGLEQVSKERVVHFYSPIMSHATVEPRYKEVPRDLKNVFILMAVHYVRVLAVPHIFYNNFGHLPGLKNMFFI